MKVIDRLNSPIELKNGKYVLWKPLEPSDEEKIKPYYDTLDDPLADLNWEMMLSWRRELSLLWSLYEGLLIIIARFEGSIVFWGPPLGKNLTIDTFRNILSLSENNDISPRVLYLWENYPLLEELRDSSLFSVEQQAKEYRYSVKLLIGLVGDRFKNKRYQARRFERTYSPRVEAYKSNHKQECLELLCRWIKAKRTKIESNHSSKLEMEALVCRRALEESIPLRGVVIRVAGRIEAFSLGSNQPNGVFNCMFEKTNLSMFGISAYVFQELARSLKDVFDEINAGEDWGVDYLAKSKSSWCPSRILDSYTCTMIR